MSRILKLIAINIAVLCVLLVVVGLLSELALRKYNPQVTFFPRFIESSDYHIELTKNAKLVQSRGDLWQFVYTTNEMGRRGAFVPPAELYSTKNVVVLGDSFTFGIGVNDEEVYTQVMSMELGDSYAVINGGMGGWGIDSQIKWFYKTGKTYQPGAVILQFTANDPFDFIGVTSIEDGTFHFSPYRLKKPAVQKFLSQSRIIQESHLYVLLRNAYDSVQKVKGGGRTDGDRLERQIRYAQMLDLFSRELNESEVDLLFLSVTHYDASTSAYIYDVQKFPIIEEAVSRLEASGLVRFVRLPLDELRKYPGSPEGHQWGKQHHEIVGTRVAESILGLE